MPKPRKEGLRYLNYVQKPAVMKAPGLLSILIMLSNVIYLNAQGLPHDVPVSRSDELTVSLLFWGTSCYGACDGQVFAEVTGGQPPYSYLWSDGSTGPGIQDLCAGIGSITVTDAAGNTATVEFQVKDLPCPAIEWTNLIITHPSNGQNNGSISLDSIPYINSPDFHVDSFWSIDSVHFTPYYIFPHLGPGDYHLYIRDPLVGCICPAGVFNLYNITATEELTASFNLYPNPVINTLQLSADIPLVAELIDMQGKRLFVSEPGTFHQISMAGYPEGIYLVRISDDRGSSYEKIVKVK